MVSRLFQIVYILMENESVTAGELAKRLEVSVRTINRDIDKLSEARIPIYTNRGRKGGISLLSDFVLNKKVLSKEEKADILSSMRVMSAVGYEDEKQALARLEEFFGESAQDWIEVELDSWSDGGFDKERFKLLKNAVLSHRKLSFIYTSIKEKCLRTVRPYKLVFRSQAWYLYAFCEIRRDFRYFKIKRMEQIRMLEDQFERIRLKETMQPYYLQQKDTFEVTFSIDKCMAYRIFDELPMDKAIEDESRYIFTLSDAQEDWFYPYILSFGEYAEVLGPEDIRNKMKQKVNELYKKYS